MKSTTGQYFEGLDHVRALAAFIVFVWHFIHVQDGHLGPPPVFPLSLLTEGHTGVALFMCLSGYLFAKLLDGKRIVYRLFLWNRFLRLAPLLVVVILIAGLQQYLAGADMQRFLNDVLWGFIKPSLPNGGWSITAEFHFYLMLPVFLFLAAKSRYALFGVLALAIVLRVLLHRELGQIQELSYWTIIGRVDQFLLGILAFHFRQGISGKHFTMVVTFLMFTAFFWYFDSLGGFYKNPDYPTASPLWIYMPTIEGVVYGMAIAWYDNSFRPGGGVISRAIARIGTYSYSIYLLHFFFVFWVAAAIDVRLVSLSNIYVALVFAVPCFFVVVPFAFVSYHCIEKPFLRFRLKYIV